MVNETVDLKTGRIQGQVSDNVVENLSWEIAKLHYRYTYWSMIFQGTRGVFLRKRFTRS